MRAPYYLSALEQARLLRQRKSARANCLNSAASGSRNINPAINAVVVTDFERAAKAAAAADRRLKRGEPRGIFDGVPMTIKESFDWSGHAFDLGRAVACATISPPMTPLR